MFKKLTARGCVAAAYLLFAATGSAASDNQQETNKTDMKKNSGVEIQERVVIDTIWPAVPVGFSLLTHGERQYVAYYNSDRRMTVGMRSLTDDAFTTTVLPSKSDQPPGRHRSSTVQGWDSHNYITMAVDSEGYIHLSGNMHASPLTYFRSKEPHDISTLAQVSPMVGSNERRCTYPKFMKGPDDSLIFHYRDGGSGNGQEIYNVYDPETRTWKRLLDTMLISGKGRSNAYMRGPQRGPDGWYHLLWMWRNTPDVATNHDLSYARSRDLLNWETAGGQPLQLPITPDDKNTIIDPVPVKGGLHNSNHHFNFDSKGRVVVSYFKHDEDGDTQAYAARFEDGQWRIRQVSDWDGRHIFRGGGSGPSTFGTRLSVRKIRQHGEGELAIPFSHWKEGSGLLVIDEESLAPLRVDPQPKPFPESLTKVQSDFPGMRVKIRGDSGSSPDPASRYVMRWETLGTNRDRPRQGELPETSELVLYKISVPTE